MDPVQGRTDWSGWLTATATFQEPAGQSPNASPPAADAAEPYPSAGVGRYQLRRELGAGGMGVVYEAYDPELERRVAIKVLRSSLDRERLTREARALAKLSHPNVVAIYDVGALGEHAFIAMELVEGTTLRAWVSERPRSFEEVLKVALQAGRGLAAAHAAGLLHRDFKPDNVMVGRDGRARVLDFGIVSAFDAGDSVDLLTRAVDGASSDSEPRLVSAEHLTAAGTLVGTPAYMAPEQFRAQTIGPASDQFSFCVVLWELVYGERPFAPKTMLDLSRGGDVGSPREPARARELPRWVRRVLERGLLPDSASRYPTMVALLDALEAGLARHTADQKLLGHRYELLPATGGTALQGAERALDRLTGRVVTLKHLTLSAESDPASPPRIALARVFRDLAGLRHPNLVSVLDFGFGRDGRAYWVLDLRDTGSDLRVASRRPGARSVIDYLIQVAHALGHLHQRGVFLGALEPDAAVVIEDQAKLVPLGPQLSGGSSAFVAPRGDAPDVSADLYALGLFALYHLAPSETRASAIASAPERLLATLELEPRVASVLFRLLRAQRAEPYATAREVAHALAEAVGRPLVTEPLEGGDGRLRAVPLAGRAAELAPLEVAVRGACDGRGAAWLVSGASGAGKSRVLEELGTLGVVHGAVVLRGQEEREGGSPYRLFREVLRGMTLLTEIDDREASVLLPVLPNLAEQLQRPLQPAPPLDALSTHARLVEVVHGILQRQERPVVLLLDDLQWARSDSLDLLRRLAERAATLPLLLVAASRDDELSRAGMPPSAMQTLHLGRLSSSAIAEITASLIGDEVAPPALLALLERETEGNAFFLVEVLRSLADKAGGFERIGRAPLPERVFAEGIRGMIQEQLRAVSGEARDLLRIAAVVGRRIDRELLSTLAPELQLDECLARCAEAAILERHDDALRFRHDRLREGVLSTLTEGERVRLHARVAAAIEREQPVEPQRYATLAFHFGQAQNVEREAHYAALAGEYALLHGAVREACELLEKARDGLATAGDPLARGRVCVMLSEASFFLTDMDRAMSYAGHAAAAVGVRLPANQRGRAAALIWQLALHIAYRVAPGLASRAPTSRDAVRVGAIAAGCAACVSISLGNAAGVLLYSLMAYNLAERARYPDLWASGTLGYGLASLGFPGLARSYFKATGRGARALEGSYPVLKTSFLLGTGDVGGAEALIRQELELVRGTGFTPGETFNWFLLGYCAYYRGDMEEADRCFALAAKAEGTRANFAPGLALVRSLGGRLVEAKTLLGKTLEPENPAVPRSIGYGVLALIHARSQDVPEALRAANLAVALAGRGTTFGYAGAAFFSGVFEAYLAELASAQREGRPARPALRRLRRLVRHCRAWSHAFRVGKPLALLYESKLARLLDRPERARALCRRSGALAESMGLGLYVTLAARELEATSSPAERRARPSKPT